MKTLTWKDFKTFGTCYDPEATYGPFEGTILDWLRNDRIDAQHRVWLFTHKGFVADKFVMSEFVCRCAESVLPVIAKHSAESHRIALVAIETKRKWVRGKASPYEMFEAKCDLNDLPVPEHNMLGDRISHSLYWAVRAVEWATETWSSDWWVAMAAHNAGQSREDQVSIAIELLSA